LTRQSEINKGVSILVSVFATNCKEIKWSIKECWIYPDSV
jgi:hypothetical protein